MTVDDKKKKILGISAYYHDSAAALVINGEVVAAAHEERFTRKKHDDSFPVNAIQYALSEYGLAVEDLDAVVFYDKPFLKFERLLETYHFFAPRGLISFISAVTSWIKEKIFMRSNIWKGLEEVNGGNISSKPVLLFTEHHLSHAASAFFPSPFKEATILTIDGVGEWATASISIGKDNTISVLREMHFPHSLGLLYSSFTYYCGFRVNSGEYKLMGLAPYGIEGERVDRFRDIIRTNLIDVKEDGSISLNMEYFSFATGLRMINDKKWTKLFGIPPRLPESILTQEYMDLALAIQSIIEDIVIRMANTAHTLTGFDNLVLAGGVALNCVSNTKLREKNIFKNIWVQPASGDAGGALGAALAAYYIYFENIRTVSEGVDMMGGSYLGPEFFEDDVLRMIRKYGASYEVIQEDEELYKKVAEIISDGNVVGWMQGRMEWGPRALGNRSILADPRNPEMQKKLNLKIKKREGFRPFAPSVLKENVGDFFDWEGESPYMLFTTEIKKSKRYYPKDINGDMYDRLYFRRSDIPAVTHLDYSARIQTVNKKDNPRYWNLINSFKDKTGIGMLVNTSFNVRGEPIVCTPEDAYRCFMNTDMDYLVIGNIIFDKDSQKSFEEKELDTIIFYND